MDSMKRMRLLLDTALEEIMCFQLLNGYHRLDNDFWGGNALMSFLELYKPALHFPGSSMPVEPRKVSQK